jgi:hypothetical protein
MKLLYNLLFFILSFNSIARADISKSTLFSLNTIYVDRDYDNNGTKLQSKETDTDFRLIRIDKSWAGGVIYSLSANDASHSSRVSYGLTAGYYSDKDFYLNFHYFLSSKYDLGAGSSYSKGNGYGIDLGFLSKITPSFMAGLLISHRSFAYTEQTTGGFTNSISSTHKEILPLFTFAVLFQ